MNEKFIYSLTVIDEKRNRTGSNKKVAEAFEIDLAFIQSSFLKHTAKEKFAFLITSVLLRKFGAMA